MKIAFFMTTPSEEEYLKSKLTEHELTFIPTPLDKQHLPEKRDFEALSLFAGCKVEREVLDALPNLKLLTLRSTGYDYVDIAEAQKRGIVVSYVPAYGDNTVAEFAFGLLLSLSRNIPQALKRVKEEGSFTTEGLQGVDLKGKTLGVLGAGRIGQNMIRFAKGFEMVVLAYDVVTKPELEAELGFKYVFLDELLKGSDVISIHVPYFPATHHLINQKNILLIKKGCLLINTARGAVVETEALIYGLKEGILGGVALDVLEEEEALKDEAGLLLDSNKDPERVSRILEEHALMDMENVLITPHNAFNTHEAVQRILDTTIENIKGFLVSQPKNLITVSPAVVLPGQAMQKSVN